MAQDPRVEMAALPQTDGQWTGGHHAASRGLLAKVVRGQKEANSLWRSKLGFHCGVLHDEKALFTRAVE